MIPVLEESRLFENQPRYALLLSWQIVDESNPNLTARGFKGDNIVPLPALRGRRQTRELERSRHKRARVAVSALRLFRVFSEQKSNVVRALPVVL